MRIDFHAHILPMADHGCDSAQTAQKQLQLAQRAGVEAVVATPHFYPHRHTVPQFLHRQERGAQLLHSIWEDGMPKVILGAEVLVCPGMERLEGLEKLCIQGTDHVILLELPFSGLTDEIWETICEMREDGYCPVLAHLNRYDAAAAKQAKELGLFVQLNAEAFHSILHRGTWKTFAQRDNMCALGSDIHGVSEVAYEEFGQALRILGDRADEVMERTRQLLRL